VLRHKQIHGGRTHTTTRRVVAGRHEERERDTDAPLLSSCGGHAAFFLEAVDAQCGTRKSKRERERAAMKRCCGREGGSGEFDIAPMDHVSRLALGPVCAQFTSQWCGPCRTMRRHFLRHAAIADSTGSPVTFVVVDVDADVCKHYAKLFDIQHIPTFLFMKNGVEVARVEGACVEELDQVLRTFDGAKAHCQR